MLELKRGCFRCVKNLAIAYAFLMPTAGLHVPRWEARDILIAIGLRKLKVGLLDFKGIAEEILELKPLSLWELLELRLSAAETGSRDERHPQREVEFDVAAFHATRR